MSSAIAANAQGSAFEVGGAEVDALPLAAGEAPAAVPQRWQNFAPGVSAARQDAQVAPSAAAPHYDEKRPETDAPQLAQLLSVVVDRLICGKG